ncbi:hypothetical protein OBCHQ24_02935 [Oceanobacillus iheyensis]|nr:hypothetical protein OBCHQ24_02935 [Oceanobacillus iheyensis]
MTNKKTSSTLYFFTILYIFLYSIFMIFIYLPNTLISFRAMVTILLPAIFFFIILLLISKKTSFKEEKYSKNKFKTILVINLALPILCIIMLVVNQQNAQFSVENWESNIKDRRFMFEDFTEEYKLLGMSKEQVQSLLGNPNRFGENESSFIYYMGNSSNLIPIDNTLLKIIFDKNNKIVEYDVLTD